MSVEKHDFSTWAGGFQKKAGERRANPAFVVVEIPGGDSGAEQVRLGGGEQTGGNNQPFKIGTRREEAVARRLGPDEALR
jgi:hypothetical protein